MKSVLAHRLLLILMTMMVGSPLAGAQEKSRLPELLALLRPLRAPEASDRLLVLRREQPALVRPLIELRRQARAAKPAGIDPDDVEMLCSTFVVVASAELAAPVRSLAALDAMLPGIEDAGDRDFLLAFDRALHLRVADAAIQRLRSMGAYDGMFSALFEGRPRVARAFMDHFLDRLNDVGYRGYAAQGAAELATAGQKKQFADEAALVWAQTDEDSVLRRAALILMKRCGRAAEFDEALAHEESLVTAELAKDPGKRSVSALLVAYENLVDLYGRTGMRSSALAYDEAYCRLLLVQCSYETQPPEARSGIAGALYDFCCRLSVAGALDAADLVLDLVLGWGYENMSWIGIDPDLSALRDREGFAEKIVAWDKNEDRSRAARFDIERWDAIVRPGVEAARKRINAADAAAQKKNDEQESKP